MPPKIVPDGLVSRGSSVTRMAGHLLGFSVILAKFPNLATTRSGYHLSLLVCHLFRRRINDR
jgi:hypothetical protein